MCGECACCGPSWTGSVNSIAAIDLLTSAVHVTFETASFGILTGLLMPFGATREMKHNCSTHHGVLLHQSRNISSDSDEIVVPRAEDDDGDEAYCPWLYKFFGLAASDYRLHLDFDTFVVALLIAMVFIGFVVEGYLFSTLRRGAVEKIYKECRKWMKYRGILLACLTCGSLVKYLMGTYYPPLDGLLDIFKVYRICTFVIVYKFMDELAHTVGIIYIKPAKKAKRGSL